MIAAFLAPAVFYRMRPLEQECGRQRDQDRPGLPLAPALGRFVTRDDFVSYLDAYVARHRIDVRHGVVVERLAPESGGWRASTSAGEWRAATVVVATGYDHTAVIPSRPGRASFDDELIHAAASSPSRDPRW